jgi:putative salt-induced outer membrane protein
MQKTLIFTCTIIGLCNLFSFSARADEVYLKNGDRLTGTIKQEDKDAITIQTESMGLVRIEMPAVIKVAAAKEAVRDDKSPSDKKTSEPDADDQKNPAVWKREVSVGFNRTTGNTREDDFAGRFFASRTDKHVDEWTLKGDLFYSSQKRKMDRQKWYLMARYAYSFGSNKKWYNFYRLETDHDRFADIDYRFVPAGGFGYWFFDTDKTKLMAEVGAGIERTHFKSNTKYTSDWVLIPRAWLEKKIFENITVSHGISYYPAFEDFNCYRLRSETSLDIKMNNHIKIRFSIFDDYNSNPPKDTKKNDMRAITSLVCSF